MNITKNTILRGLSALIALTLVSLFEAGSGSIAAAQGTCWFTGTAESAPIYAAPLTHPSQQINAITENTAVEILAQQGEHFQVITADNTTGWVDRRSGTVSGDCALIPMDNTPLADFATVCTIRTNAENPLYQDQALSQVAGGLPAGTWPVLDQAAGAYYVAIDHAYEGWLAATAGVPGHQCATIPPSTPYWVRTTENARLWSAPNAQSGELLASLPVGVRVHVIAGPITGPIRVDTADLGDWLYVQVNGYPTGWVWIARLTFDAPSEPNTYVYATVTSGGRLWDAPTVRTGSVVWHVAPGDLVRVFEGPARGPIRFDTNDMGDWYYISTLTGRSGWLWSGRLTFD